MTPSPTTSPKRERERVYVVRPRCPGCGATNLHSYKTCQNGDGSVTRYTTCRTCGCKFFVVVE